jgi:hypothetical protein
VVLSHLLYFRQPNLFFLKSFLPPSHLLVPESHSAVQNRRQLPNYLLLRHPSPKLQPCGKPSKKIRNFYKTDTPDPTLGIDMDEFTSFTQHLRSSKRVLALVGAGLSVASGLATFRGDDGRWRGIEPQHLSNIEVLEKNLVKVWWFSSDCMKRAQEVKPNRGHIALARLAKEKEGFFAVNQIIDGMHEGNRNLQGIY